jgi:CAAX prenyl protease-like protein
VNATREISMTESNAVESPRLPDPKSQEANSVPAWAYVAPFVVFMAGTYLEGQAVTPEGTIVAEKYVSYYCVKILAVLVAMVVSRKAWRDLKPLPRPGTLVLSILIGAFVTVFWVGLDGIYPPLPESLGKRSAFDPTSLEPGTKWVFLAFRTLGLVLIVPVIEELFVRNFLLRFVTDADWQKIEPWAFNSTAAAVSTFLFVSAHPEWFPALLCGVIWLWLLRRSRSVSALVISHAVANLGLGIYSVVTGDWRFL